MTKLLNSLVEAKAALSIALECIKEFRTNAKFHEEFDPNASTEWILSTSETMSQISLAIDDIIDLIDDPEKIRPESASN